MSLCVLVAEDDDDMRALLEDELGRLGWSVVAASDGSEAEAATRSGDLSVAVLDVRMPGLTGLELLRRLRHGGSRLPVVLISGFASGLDDLDPKHGAVVLAKPFSIQALRAAIAEAATGLAESASRGL